MRPAPTNTKDKVTQYGKTVSITAGDGGYGEDGRRHSNWVDDINDDDDDDLGLDEEMRTGRLLEALYRDAVSAGLTKLVEVDDDAGELMLFLLLLFLSRDLLVLVFDDDDDDMPETKQNKRSTFTL